MSNQPSEEEVRASIVPKSDQLNSDDLITGPITVTITGVRKGDNEQPIIVDIDGHRPYKPGKTCRRILIAQYSDDPKKWIGQRMTLYRDENVQFAGVRVGGIRISHMTGLDKPKTFVVTVSRGKKAEYTIHPLTMTASEQAYIADARQEIEAAETMEVLKAVGWILKEKSKAVQEALRPVYAAKQKELSE